VGVREEPEEGKTRREEVGGEIIVGGKSKGMEE
jgi:hypothetical protein